MLILFNRNLLHADSKNEKNLLAMNGEVDGSLRSSGNYKAHCQHYLVAGALAYICSARQRENV
jgi:hypothetical protein